MADTTNLAGGRQNPAQAFVTCDQVTVLGDGTSEDPIRLASPGATGEFEASFVPSTPDTPLPGLVVIVAPDKTVDSADEADNIFAVGLIVSVDDSVDPPVVRVRTSGPVTLTTEQWDLVAGGSGGLTAGSLYFLSSTEGEIRDTAPTDPGTFVCQVGVAINTTTLVLSTPVFPRENS